MLPSSTSALFLKNKIIKFSVDCKFIEVCFLYKKFAVFFHKHEKFVEPWFCYLFTQIVLNELLLQLKGVGKQIILYFPAITIYIKIIFTSPRGVEKMNVFFGFRLKENMYVCVCVCVLCESSPRNVEQNDWKLPMFRP